MDQYTHVANLNRDSDWNEYNLPSWIHNFFYENVGHAYQGLYYSNGSRYLYNKMFNLGSSQRVGQAFLVYQADFKDELSKSRITYTRGILESIWGFKFEYIAHPTQTKTILFYCFALYEVARSSSLLSHDIVKAVHPTDHFLEKLIAESQRGTDPLLSPLPNMYRLPYIKTSQLPNQPDSFTQHIPFEKSVAYRLTELVFAENKNASSFYINLNPNLFLKNMTDAFLMYKTSDYPPILALEKIVYRDPFLKEVLVFRGGLCYLWNLKMLSTLRLESRESFDDQHLDVQQISMLSLTKISWYLKTFYNLDILVEQIESTLVDIALESSKKTAILSQIGSDKIDKASQFLTIYFSMPGGILEKFQDGLESISFEGISFRDAQKFLVQFGHFSFLKDDFKMSGLLKSYVFDLNGDSIAIMQKSKKWVFTKNGKICSTNPFQERGSFDDIEIFSKNVLKNLEKPKGKDKE
jgi:hypothetical protein